MCVCHTRCVGMLYSLYGYAIRDSHPQTQLTVPCHHPSSHPSSQPSYGQFALVEQILCTQAEFFIGTQTSMFSDIVMQVSHA